jgi:hypothetical protein
MHTTSRNPAFKSLLLSKCEGERTSNLKRPFACCVLGNVCCGGTWGAARLAAKKRRICFAAVYMTTSQQALAPRSSTKLATVQEILGTLVARYRTDEVLTAVRQIPDVTGEFCTR